MLFEYFILLIFLIIIIFIALILFFFSFFFINKNENLEKNLAYECGFDPFEESRKEFNIKFYLVGILFIIFDLEIIFIFPWAITSSVNNLFSYLIIFFFLFILFIGFIYEWIAGALEWN
jgi:NADH-quinone oxidoreductase subunit A